MGIALWIVSALLAVAFLVAGASKLTQNREQLAKRGMAYVEDFTPAGVKRIGAAEVLAAIGLILPWATGIAEFLTPAAAIGLVLLMVGAIVTHLRRKEPQVIVANVVLLLLAAFVALGRLLGW